MSGWATLMERFHWRVGHQITLRGTIYLVNLTFQIVGVLSDKAPPACDPAWERAFAKIALDGGSATDTAQCVAAQYYERLRAAGKPGKVAVIAAMRKLLVAVWSVATHRKSFVPILPTPKVANHA